MISTLTGAEVEPTPRYWAEQARSPVRFADAVATLTARGVHTFTELGPDAILTPMLRECAPTTTAIPTLRAKHPETRTITEAFAHLFTFCSNVDGRSFLPRPTARRRSA
jgi:acyl transferase domain-containing protein